MDGTLPTAATPLRSRWSLPAVLRRAREVAVQQGAAALWFKILGEVCYRRTYLYKEVLENDLDLPQASIPLEVRALTPNEIPLYAANAPRADQREIAARLDAGHVCHAAWSEGSLVGYVWSAPGQAPIDYLGVAMELPAGAVYGYEIFVRPDCRKLGVAVAMIRERRVLLLESGYNTGYSVLMPENTPAVGFQRAVKRIRIGMICVVWLWPWRRGWVSMEDPQASSPFALSTLSL